MPSIRVLLLTYGVPWPPNSGTRIRDYHLLRVLAESAEVTLCCFAKDEREIPDLSELRRLCLEVVVYRPPGRSPAGHARAIGKAIGEGRPLATCPFFYPEFAAELRAIAGRRAVNVFQIEHSFLAAYRVAAPAGCRTVLSFHNIGWLQYARMARLDTGFRRRCGFWLKALLMRGWEAGYGARFDRCIAVSELDAALLRRGNPAVRISVVENGVDCRRFQPLPEAPSGSSILFVGALGYPPNADAVRFFCLEILPVVRRKVPEARFVVVGQNAPPEVLSLAASGALVLADDVPDVVPYYRQARLTVAPLRAGGGTRLKILESMALARAVVSTRIGCEGIDAEDGRELLIADGCDGFAAHVVALLEDEALRLALTAEARRKVEAAYDWAVLGARQLALYSALLSPEDR